MRWTQAIVSHHEAVQFMNWLTDATQRSQDDTQGDMTDGVDSSYWFSSPEAEAVFSRYPSIIIRVLRLFQRAAPHFTFDIDVAMATKPQDFSTEIRMDPLTITSDGVVTTIPERGRGTRTGG